MTQTSYLVTAYLLPELIFYFVATATTTTTIAAATLTQRHLVDLGNALTRPLLPFGVTRRAPGPARDLRALLRAE
ncbi:hypothetical protein ACCO45_010778 [Purpureocillium lilacinum]|uniref:Uncharacterized protein n=1 Tax=Purpureocillium lilacinum TaxID=33203 RepID=A0ACC4DFR5_PURLI